MTRTGLIVALLCLMTIWVLSRILFVPLVSPDLAATVFAGHFWNIGQADQIYNVPEDGIFRMLPPPSWQDWLTAQGSDGPVFPFIYPPLWIAVGSLLDRIATSEQISLVAYHINPVILWGTLLLVIKASATASDFPRLMLLSVALSFPTWTVFVALAANQPQILVSFLVVLAIERSRASSPILAGLALAVAASIKLYPALFALLWLGQREYRACASFAIAGALLALLSVALVGWPLHQQYLELIRSISGTFLVTTNSVSLDSLLGSRFYFDQLQILTASLEDGGPVSWGVGAKPVPYRIATACLLVGSVVGLGMMARRSRVDPILVWTLAVTIISLLSPLSWTHSYIPTLALLPSLIRRLPVWQFVILAGLVLVPLSVLNGIALPAWGPISTTGVVGLTLFSITLAAIIFWGPAQEGRQSAPRVV
jgi:hypothetical protein